LRWLCGSGGAGFVPMVQSADLGDRHHAPACGRRDRTWDGRVLLPPELRSFDAIHLATADELGNGLSALV